MALQKIIAPNGDVLVVLPEAEYIDLTEEREDRAAIDRIRTKLARGEEEFVPSAVADRMLAGENLVKIWREYRSLTVAALAEKAGISHSYLSQIESGKREGTISTYKKLAAALNLSIEDLV